MFRTKPLGDDPQPQRRLVDWSPSRRPPRHQVRPVPVRLKIAEHLDGLKDPAAWTLESVTAAEGLGHVRSGMTYDKEYGTSASFYEKPGRIQFLEGPNEPAIADHLEMNPRCLDFQMQPLDILFRRADGKLIHKYPDIAIEFDDNTVRFGEIKSNLAWFNAPGVRKPLDRIDAALASKDLPPLLRICGEPFRQERVIAVQHAAMDARHTSFDDSEVATVKAALEASGGCMSYGTLCAVLGGRSRHAPDKLYAMLLRRLVAFDLRERPSSVTPVTMPKVARPYALREALNRLRRKAT